MDLPQVSPFFTRGRKRLDHYLYQGLKTIAIAESINFHMPGHKNRDHNMPWLKDAIRLDTTETYGADNLLHPDTIIKDSLRGIADVFGAKRSLFSVNGTTGSIYIAQNVALNPGETLLVQRDSHKSVYNGAILNRLDLDYVYPKYHADKKIVTDIDPEAVEEKLSQNNKIKAVMVVYPNYYGITSDLGKIAEIVHAHGAVLIVDEAHGSHMHFSDRLPSSALSCGADIVLQSTHKTLPSLTQTSLIHLGTDRVDPYRLKRASALYQTTSPSYLFMTSIENAIAYMDSKKGRSALDRLIDMTMEFRKRLIELPGIELLEDTDQIYGLDPTRVLFRHESLAGGKLKDELYRNANISLEMADLYYALALCTVNNTQADFDALYSALEKIAANHYEEKLVRDIEVDMIPATIEMPMYEAYYREKEEIRLEDALGCIAGQQITPYPPGVPMVLPGEVIMEPILKKLLELKKVGIDIVGTFGPGRSFIEVLKKP